MITASVMKELILEVKIGDDPKSLTNTVKAFYHYSSFL